MIAIEYRIVVNGRSCENVPYLLLLVLAMNCLQNLETDFILALPEGEPTTSDSYVSSSAHVALVKHNPDHKPATFFLSSNKRER